MARVYETRLVRSVDDIRPLLLCSVVSAGRTVPVFAWAVGGGEGTVLVDTGMIDVHPAVEEWQPSLHAWPDLGEVVAIVNTHLHFDHCGGNRRFAGVPTYVQRAELDAASGDDYLTEWVRFPGESYVPLDDDSEILPGISVLSTPGHTAGHQAVVVATDEGPVVLAGDVTYVWDELASSSDPSIERIRALGPRRVWLAHSRRPWDPA